MGESQAAILERQFIAQLVRAVATAQTDERRIRCLAALLDLIQHSDPSLDTSRLDVWTQRCLRLLEQQVALDRGSWGVALQVRSHSHIAEYRRED